MTNANQETPFERRLRLICEVLDVATRPGQPLTRREADSLRALVGEVHWMEKELERARGAAEVVIAANRPQWAEELLRKMDELSEAFAEANDMLDEEDEP